MVHQIKKPRPTLLVINDNHLVVPKGEDPFFKGSQFHRYLTAFDIFDILLSAPVILPGKGMPPNNVVIDGITVAPRPAYGEVKSFLRHLPGSAFAQLKALRQQMHRADAVLLVHPSVMAPIFTLANRSHRLPFCIYLIGDSEEVLKGSQKHSTWLRVLGGLYAKFDWWLLMRLARSAHAVFTLGRSLEQKCQFHGVHTIPAMTSLVRNQNIREPKPKAIGNPIHFLTVCRLSPEKNIEVALQALNALAAKGTELHYVVAGDGPWRQHLQQYIDKLVHIKGRVQFTGWLKETELQAQYEKADIFLLPSLSEGIPKVVLDAMAEALPVIASNVGGIPDLVGNGRGWLCAPSDDKCFLASIEECLDSDKRLERLEKAHAFIKAHSMEEEANKIQKVLYEAFVKD